MQDARFPRRKQEIPADINRALTKAGFTDGTKLTATAIKELEPALKKERARLKYVFRGDQTIAARAVKDLEDGILAILPKEFHHLKGYVRVEYFGVPFQ